MQGMLAGSFHRKLPVPVPVVVFQGAPAAQTLWYHGFCVNTTCKIAFAKCEKILFAFVYSAKELFTNKNYAENGLMKPNFLLCLMF